MEPFDHSQHLLEEFVQDDGLETDVNADYECEHRNQRRLLFVSHFLSTWNSRAFEFGAFLFLASIYPGTLLPASVYALTRSASATILSPWLGRYVDTAERLTVMRLSIVGQRISVVASCGLLFWMSGTTTIKNFPVSSAICLAILCALACLEKLSAVVNTISAERDWVVVIAGGDTSRLTILNSQMRRIDLFCKLGGPLAISFVDAASSQIAILVTCAMTVIALPVEYYTIARLYKLVPALGYRNAAVSNETTTRRKGFFGCAADAGSGLKTYLRHRAFRPSFALALLYLTVLSFAGQMITYLYALGVNSAAIGTVRGVAVAFEMSATWLAPKVIQHIGPTRAGMWFINWQILWLITSCIFFWNDQSTTIAAVGSIIAVIASRVGLWGFDLSAQIIIQDEVEAEFRGVFSSQEFAFQNGFEMLSFAQTILFSKPAQFKYPATISTIACGSAGVLYATFVRQRRGHLVHLSQCTQREAKTDRRQGSREGEEHLEAERNQT